MPGLRKLDGDEAVYYKLNEEGNLAGIVSTHVDDFDMAGRKKFVDILTKDISKVFDVSTVESDCFRFTGIDVKKVDGDEEVYYKLNEEGNLEGMVSTHVDDFDVAGRKKFVEMLTKEIRRVLDVSTVESDCFRFIGIDVKKVKGGIDISMEDYA